MKKTVGGLLLLAALGGCVPSQPGAYMSHVRQPGSCQGGCYQSAYRPSAVPGVMGPWGEPVTALAPARQSVVSPAEAAARATFAQSLPQDVVQQITWQEDSQRGMNILQAGAACPPGGCPPGSVPPIGMTGVPGFAPPVGSGAPGAVAALGALTGGTPQPFAVQRTEVRFAGPSGMKISWYAPTADGKAEFTPTAIVTPGRYNFLQASIYRLKLSGIPRHPGLELYPTLEVVPANSKTASFLAHSAVPLTFTNADFDQVKNGNYLVKVVYLPHPTFQDQVSLVPDEITTSRLEPGLDPIQEALRRGSILLVVRMGNIDLEAPNTPGINAPSPFQPKPPPPPFGGIPPGMLPPGMPGPGMPGMPGMPSGVAGPGGMPPFGMMGPRGPMMGMPGMPPGMPLPPQFQGAPTSLPPNGAPQQPLAPPGLPTGKKSADGSVQPVNYQANQ